MTFLPFSLRLAGRLYQNDKNVIIVNKERFTEVLLDCIKHDTLLSSSFRLIFHISNCTALTHFFQWRSHTAHNNTKGIHNER